MAIYSISQNKIIEYRDIPYYISFPANMGNTITIDNKKYLPLRTDAGDGKTFLYCIENNKTIEVNQGGGGLYTSLNKILAMNKYIDGKDDFYKSINIVESIEPLKMKEIFHFDNKSFDGKEIGNPVYMYEIEDKYYMMSNATAKTVVADKNTYKIDTLIQNFGGKFGAQSLYSYYKKWVYMEF